MLPDNGIKDAEYLTHRRSEVQSAAFFRTAAQASAKLLIDQDGGKLLGNPRYRAIDSGESTSHTKAAKRTQNTDTRLCALSKVTVPHFPEFLLVQLAKIPCPFLASREFPIEPNPTSLRQAVCLICKNSDVSSRTFGSVGFLSLVPIEDGSTVIQWR